MSDHYSLRLHIEQVEDGQYLATSDELPGLIAQGRTVQEAVEIAQDVAAKLLHSYRDHGDPIPPALRPLGVTADLDVPVTA